MQNACPSSRTENANRDAPVDQRTLDLLQLGRDLVDAMHVKGEPPHLRLVAPLTPRGNGPHGPLQALVECVRHGEPAAAADPGGVEEGRSGEGNDFSIRRERFIQCRDVEREKKMRWERGIQSCDGCALRYTDMSSEERIESERNRGRMGGVGRLLELDGHPDFHVTDGRRRRCVGLLRMWGRCGARAA